MVTAILLDVGGVLLVPDERVTGGPLEARGIDYDPARWLDAHYHGVHGVDTVRPSWDGGGAPTTYLDGYLSGLGVDAADIAAVREDVGQVFARPSVEVWRRVTPWARAGLEMLANEAVPTAVVSNSDGTVAAQLREHELAQVGPGPGLDVAAIIDSSEVGVAKPDPAVFEPAIRALGVEVDRCVYIGDTTRFDVAAGQAAGMGTVHLDPLASCTSTDHPHARTLPDALEQAFAGQGRATATG